MKTAEEWLAKYGDNPQGQWKLDLNKPLALQMIREIQKDALGISGEVERVEMTECEATSMRTWIAKGTEIPPVLEWKVDEWKPGMHPITPEKSQEQSLEEGKEPERMLTGLLGTPRCTLCGEY